MKKIVSKSDFLTSNSKEILVEPSKKYKINFPVIAKIGEKFSIYVSVILLNSNSQEINRYVRWVSKFNNKLETYPIIFTTTELTKKIVLGIRGNFETPLKSDLELEIPDLSLLHLEEIKNIEDSFDSISDYALPKFKSLTDEEENILEKKIIWLLGSPRSGTTWLGTQLLDHPVNLIWDEISLGYHLGIVEQRFDPEKKIALSRFYDQQKNNPLYFFSEQHKNNWLPYLKKLILARIFSFSQSLEKNVIIKEPIGGNGADIIADCLPNSKIIFLIRDGRDILDSRLDMHSKNSWANLPEITTPERRNQLIYLYSEMWNLLMDILEKTYNKHNPKLRYKLKYEDLKNNLFPELKKIYEFLEIPITDDKLLERIRTFDFKSIPSNKTGKGKFYRSAKINGWKDSFNIQEQKLINSLMGKTLLKFGYEFDH